MSTTTNPEEYNGWANRETWALVLHLDNDQRLQATAHYLTTQGPDAIRKYVECVREAHAFQTFPDPHSPRVSEAWRLLLFDVGSTWRVEWREVHAHFLAAIEEEKEHAAA